MARYIDANKLVFSLNEAQVEFDDYYKGLGKAKEIVDAALAEDVRPVVRGKWIPISNASQGYYCSICGRCVFKDCMEKLIDSYPFCHCGADMREVEEWQEKKQ